MRHHFSHVSSPKSLAYLCRWNGRFQAMIMIPMVGGVIHECVCSSLIWFRWISCTVISTCLQCTHDPRTETISCLNDVVWRHFLRTVLAFSYCHVADRQRRIQNVLLTPLVRPCSGCVHVLLLSCSFEVRRYVAAASRRPMMPSIPTGTGPIATLLSVILFAVLV